MTYQKSCAPWSSASTQFICYLRFSPKFLFFLSKYQTVYFCVSWKSLSDSLNWWVFVYPVIDRLIFLRFFVFVGQSITLSPRTTTIWRLPLTRSKTCTRRWRRNGIKKNQISNNATVYCYKLRWGELVLTSEWGLG